MIYIIVRIRSVRVYSLVQVPAPLLGTDGRFVDLSAGTAEPLCLLDGSGALAPGAAPAGLAGAPPTSGGNSAPAADAPTSAAAGGDGSAAAEDAGPVSDREAGIDPSSASYHPPALLFAGILALIVAVLA